jgi:hypothetical protein
MLERHIEKDGDRYRLRERQRKDIERNTLRGRHRKNTERKIQERH